MELLYIYIKEYANIKNIGFNFSLEFTFEIVENELRITKRESVPINIFNEIFLNITAIAGINGSGKSSLISFIEYFFTTPNTGRHHGSVIIYKNIDSVIHIYGLTNILINCSNEILYKLQDTLDELHNGVIPILYSSGIEILNEPILSSNFLHITGERILRETQINANKYLCEQIIDLLKAYQWPKIPSDKVDEFDLLLKLIVNHNFSLVEFKKNELNVLIKFICNHSSNIYNFIPQWLKIRFNFTFFASIKTDLNINSEFINSIYNKIKYNNIIDESTTKKELKYLILVQIFLFILSVWKKYKLTFHQLDLDSKLSNFNSLIDTSDQLYFISKLISESDFTHTGRYVNFDRLIELTNNLDFYISNINVFKVEEGIYYLEKDSNAFNIFKLYFEFWNFEEFAFSFEMNELSTGEKALLNLFARIYSISNNSFFNEKTIWLFIDEGELYLHPEFQRQFFSDLHNYLSIFFSNRKIQLILTTHSPFILSNLPKDNVMLLKKNANNLRGC